MEIKRLLQIIVLQLLMLTALIYSACACDVDLTIAKNTITVGESNDFEVSLSGACPTVASLKIEVTDPEGKKHTYIIYANSGKVSYPGPFSNAPNTDVPGSYSVEASATIQSNIKPAYSSFFVYPKTGECRKEIYNSNIMAEMQTTYSGFAGGMSKDIVTCCDTGAKNCCHLLELDKDCKKVGGDFTGYTEVDEVDDTKYFRLCFRVDESSSPPTIKYTVMDSTKYFLAGSSTEGDKTIFYIVNKNRCIVSAADMLGCSASSDPNAISGASISMNFLLNKDVYELYIQNMLATQTYGQKCSGGFYTPFLDIYKVITSRYYEVYGALTPYLYCYQAPELIKKSKLCHTINFAWYTVVNTSYSADKANIDLVDIDKENRWNNLSGYIVLGHVCTDTGEGLFQTQPQTPLPPCNYPYMWPCMDKGDCIYNKIKNPDMMADRRTDVQIPVFSVIKEEVESISSNISIIGSKVCRCGAAVDRENAVFGYSNYRSCNPNDLNYYRLFDEDSVWVKVFAVTPELEDEDYSAERRGWDLNWSRTSPQEGKKVTIYIGGGCKRTSANYFNELYGMPPAPDTCDCSNCGYCLVEKDMFHSAEYLTPIIDYVNVTVYDGFNKPVVYNVKGRNLLTFPPADSITDNKGNIIFQNNWEGIRYSYFRIEHNLPDNAAYIMVKANYTCRTQLNRMMTCKQCECNYCCKDYSCWCCGATETYKRETLDVEDSSTVYDTYVVEFLEHVNEKDNCKLSNPIMWNIASGTLERTYDSGLGKHIFNLVGSTKLVSKEPVDLIDKVIEVKFTNSIEVGLFCDNFGNCQNSFTLSGSGSGGWTRAKIYVTSDNPGKYMIRYKTWSDGSPEPSTWNEKEIPAISGLRYWTIVGNNVLVDPEPSCGIEISGAYEVKNAFGKDFVTGGCIRVKMVPDILSSFILSAGDAKTEYKRSTYPAKHILFGKEKAISRSDPPIRTYEYGDQYGYLSGEFKYNEKCGLPQCPANCVCKYGNIFAPQCLEAGGYIQRQDCICPINDCFYYPVTDAPNPCSSERTYHEFEGLYYDFVDFDAFYSEPSIDAAYVAGEDKYYRRIGIGEIINGKYYGVNHTIDANRINSHLGEYRIYFSASNMEESYFKNSAKINLFTHYRNKVYTLNLLKKMDNAEMTYNIKPSNPADIKAGEKIEIDVTLTCGGKPLSDSIIKVKATNYEMNLIGVSREGETTYIKTDANGKAKFSFVMGKEIADITLIYETGDMCLYEQGKTCGGTGVNFVIGGGPLYSFLLSFEFILLVIIFIIILFAYRLFQKGRLDFESMWQELKGEKD